MGRNLLSCSGFLPHHPLSPLLCEAVIMASAYPGFTDRILKVDLSTGQREIQSRGESFYRTYFGGRAFIAHELLTCTESGVDPFGPDNLLVFAPGVITGAPIGGCGRNSVGAKSPLTGCYGDAEVGGYWGAELKKAGYDAIVISGKSDSQVYLYIRDDRVELRDAGKLSGKKTAQVEELIKEETGRRSVRICQCGPAGEKLVRIACVINDLHHFAGRCGLGAVMGSKNLRAIAVSGSGKVTGKNPEALSRVSDWLRKNHGSLSGVLHEIGTISTLHPLNICGGLPTRNFREGCFEGAEKIDGEAMRERLLVSTGTCFACPIRCKRVVEASRPWKVNRIYGGPEYETAAAFGSNCGVDDLVAVSKAGELCNAYGLDTISTGGVIAFAMECYEKGIIDDQVTGGLQLRFGNAGPMVKLVGMIARREGIGDLLAEGVRRASQAWGSDAEKIALEVKGQEVPMHEPRYKHGMGLGYALSPTGADHCHNIHDSLYSREGRHLKKLRALGILEPLDVTDLGAAKVRLYKYESTFRNFLNCAVLCYFLPYDHNQIVDIVNGVTGWNTSLWELMKVGERAVNLTRVYNVREGLDAKDDYLPARFFEPFTEGPLRGVSIDRRKLERAKKIFYRMMGWSPGKGIPGLGILNELEIGWAHHQMKRGTKPRGD